MRNATRALPLFRPSLVSYSVEDFGQGRDSLPNAIYVSGDTVYVEELKQMAERFHICAAIFNLGNAHAHTDMTDLTSPRYQITMDGRQAARLVREIKATILFQCIMNRGITQRSLEKSCVRFSRKKESTTRYAGSNLGSLSMFYDYAIHSEGPRYSRGTPVLPQTTMCYRTCLQPKMSSLTSKYHPITLVFAF